MLELSERPFAGRSPHLSDAIARALVLMLTPGNVSDVNLPPAPLEHAGRVRYLLGDKRC